MKEILKINKIKLSKILKYKIYNTYINWNRVCNIQ